MPRDEAAVLDIHQAATDVLEFKESVDRKEFFEDRKTQSAIVHHFVGDDRMRSPTVDLAYP